MLFNKDMIKSFLMMLCMFTTLTVQAQSADERIGILMNESRWFELERELKNTPADSVNPFLHKMAAAITHHYFNRPDSACIVLGDLLNNHQKELGDNTFSMAMLMGMNLARTGRYTEAADLIQNLYDQLKTQGADSTQTDGLLILVRQYRAFADKPQSAGHCIRQVLTAYR